MEKSQSGNFERKSAWGLLGATISALVASVCCVGPLVLLVLGITGAWIGNLTALAPYRPIFVIVALGFLGFTFYSVYRKPKTESCPVESPCANLGGKRRYKIILWVVTALILGLLVFPYLVPHVFAENPTVEKVQMEKVVLEVKNMTCVSCVVGVKKSLTRLNGIKEAKVTLEPPEAVVIFDPVKVKVEDLIKATTNAGYPSSIKQRKGNWEGMRNGSRNKNQIDMSRVWLRSRGRHADRCLSVPLSMRQLQIYLDAKGGRLLCFLLLHRYPLPFKTIRDKQIELLC